MKIFFAIIGIRLEHHLRRPLPVGQPVRAGADRVRADVVAVFFDHLARDRAGGAATGEVVQPVRLRFEQLDLKRVSVQRSQAFQRRVVIHLVGRAHPFQQFVRAGDIAFDFGQVRRCQLWIKQALDRIDIILRNQLAFFAAKNLVVVEIDPGLHPHGEGREVGRDFRHRYQRIRNQFHRTGQMIIGERRIKHAVVDDIGINVADLLRIEAGLRHFKSIAQDLFRIGERPRGGDGALRGLPPTQQWESHAHGQQLPAQLFETHNTSWKTRQRRRKKAR